MLKLLRTSDDSYTLYNEALDETYHSKHGAVQESRHVFIQNGLLSVSTKEPVNLLEIGFGTGLNALLTLLEFDKAPFNIRYTGIEPFPLNKELVEAIDYRNALHLSEDQYGIYLDMHKGKVKATKENSSFLFELIQNEFLHCRFTHSFHLLYFDAFAPGKQAGMWDTCTLQHCYELLQPQGTLVTYCAKGEVKRALKSCGFKVETLPGPPGKREMIRAIKG